MDAASLDAMDAPRSFHYVFAHRALPMLAAKNARLLQDVLRRDGAAFLRLQWKATCRALHIEPQPSEAIGYGPGCDVMGRVALGYRGEQRIAGYDVVFVQLPLALQVREAHFVAILHRRESTRYVAWERTLEGGARVSEWQLTAEGPRHRKIGPIHGDTSFEAFADALASWLGRPAEVDRPPTIVPAVREPMKLSPVVTWSDAALIAGLLLAWLIMVTVLTLL